MGDLESLLVRGFDDELTGLDLDAMGAALEDAVDPDGAFGSRSRRRGAREGRRRPIGREQLRLDPPGVDPGGDERRATLFDHAEGAAEEIAIDVLRRNDRPDQERDALAVDPAVEDLDLLRFAREHVKDRQAPEMAVLQLFER